MAKIKHIHIPEAVYFVTTNTINKVAFFKNQKYCQILLDCILFQRVKKRIYLYQYVIMPTHFHVILQLKDKWTLSKVMQSIKGNSSYRITHIQNWIAGQECPAYANNITDHLQPKRISPAFLSNNQRVGPPRADNQRVSPTFQSDNQIRKIFLTTIWQRSYYSHNIRNEKDYFEKSPYIQYNPVDAKIVSRPENYRWSSFFKFAPKIDKII